MSAPNVGNQRRNKDVFKLIEKNYKVKYLNDNDICVNFYGPKDTLYEGGIWRVVVHFPDKYPFEPPFIGFVNKIYHPNIDEQSGAICLNVIHQNWTALYDLTNIFDTFLPQLLAYPNATDPLNIKAASLFNERPEDYKKRVREFIRKYATEKRLKKYDTDNTSESGSSSSLSSINSTADEVEKPKNE